MARADIIRYALDQGAEFIPTTGESPAGGAWSPQPAPWFVRALPVRQPAWVWSCGDGALGLPAQPPGGQPAPEMASS